MPFKLCLSPASLASMALGSRMRMYCRKSNTPGRDTSEVRTTVYLSGVSMLVHQLLPTAAVWAKALRLGSRTRSMLYFTSSLVNSRPSWNSTPLRRLSLICLLSLLRSQLSARRGWISRWSP